MTWNLQWRERADWRQRQERVAATLQAVRPDVLGLQEVWATTETTLADLLAGRLGMHAAFAAPSLPPPPDPPQRPDQAGVEVGVALLSRWPVLRVERRRLPSWHRPEVAALAATLDHPAGPLHAVVFCADWEPRRSGLRLAQTRALAGLLRDPSRDGPLPALLVGDLNAPPETPEIRALTGELVDAWAAARGPGDPGHTLSRANPIAPRAAWQIDRRIDYVLARPGTPRRPVVVERAFLAGQQPLDGLHPSDHYAVVADLRAEVRRSRAAGAPGGRRRGA
jgi:endonuclease/exonuclease/phosphatase family metal-dependent hydrolase